MGITNTIAKLKAYFEAWHSENNTHQYLDEEISGLKDKIATLESIWKNEYDNEANPLSFLTILKNLINNFNRLTANAENETIKGLLDKINGKADKGELIQNIKKVTTVAASGNQSAVQSNAVNGWVGPNALGYKATYTNNMTFSADKYDLYVNPYLRLAMIVVEGQYNYYTSYSNSSKDTGIVVPSKILPPSIIKVPVNPYTQAELYTKNGHIQMRSIYSKQKSMSVDTTLMWHY